MEFTAAKTFGPSRTAAFGFGEPQNGSEWLSQHRGAPTGRVEVPDRFDTATEEALAGLTPEQVAMVRRAEAERERLAAYLRARNAEYDVAHGTAVPEDGSGADGAGNAGSEGLSGREGASGDSEDGCGDIVAIVGEDEAYAEDTPEICDAGGNEGSRPEVDRWIEVIIGRARRAFCYALGSRRVLGSGISGITMPLAGTVTLWELALCELDPHEAHSGRGPPVCG